MSSNKSTNDDLIALPPRRSEAESITLSELSTDHLSELYSQHLPISPANRELIEGRLDNQPPEIIRNTVYVENGYKFTQPNSLEALVSNQSSVSDYHRAEIQSVGAATTHADITLVDHPISHNEGNVRWRDIDLDYEAVVNITEQELILIYPWSNVVAYTGVRMCKALLSELVLDHILTSKKISPSTDDGETELKKKIPTDRIRKRARQLGFLSPDDWEPDDYSERLKSELKSIQGIADKIEEGNGFDGEKAAEVLQRAHGLAGTVTHILDALGWDVIHLIDFPQYNRNYHSDKEAISKFIATQSTIASRIGHYPAYRILYEPRNEKREFVLGTPEIDDTEPIGKLIVNWVLRGQRIYKLADQIKNLNEMVSLQRDTKSYVPFSLPVTVAPGKNPYAIWSVLNRLIPDNHRRPTYDAVLAFQTLSRSLLAVAHAAIKLNTVRQIGADFSLLDVRQALATLDPAFLVPTSNTRNYKRNSESQRMISALLAASQPLTTSELANRADVVKETIRNHRDQLKKTGLLATHDLGSGRPTEYRLRLPFETETSTTDLIVGRKIDQHQSPNTQCQPWIGKRVWYDNRTADDLLVKNDAIPDAEILELGDQNANTNNNSESKQMNILDYT